eukprot:scpid27026/ scgid11201/ Dihydrodipicolinate synthase
MDGSSSSKTSPGTVDISATGLPRGAWPTMITPFHEDGSIDYQSLQSLVDWFIDNGVAGLFTVCLSSEMYDLSNSERLELARAVKKYSTGRVPVVASGTFGGSVEDMADFVRSMAKEVDAVVVLVNQLASQDEDDDAWRCNVQKLLDLTPGVCLGLYECPVPYKRFISLDNLRWALSTNRFFFHKDTECKKVPIKAKIDVVKEFPDTPFRFLNANIETLQYSQSNGGDGFSGISANFCPAVIAWLCEHHSTREQAEQVQEFLGLSQNLIMWKYPCCAKKYHQMFGVTTMKTTCKASTPDFNDIETMALADLRSSIQDTRQLAGIPDLAS